MFMSRTTSFLQQRLKKQFTLYLLLNTSNYVPLYLSYVLPYVTMYQYLLIKTCYLMPCNHALYIPYSFTLVFLVG